MVADQSGNFTELINKLNELMDHVRSELLLKESSRARAMANGLLTAANNYIENENPGAEMVRQLEEILANPSEQWLEY